MSSKKMTKKETDLLDQLSLFEIKDLEYSNAFDFYDLLPKYDYRKKRYYPITDENAVIEKSWIRKALDHTQKLFITIKPASVIKDGKSWFVYPSLREELVEDAIRKIAVSGDGSVYKGEAGCFFTLYQLRKELVRTGHNYTVKEIKEALNVLAESNILIKSQDNKSVLNSSFITTLALDSKKNLEEHGQAKCFVTFNPTVTDAIKSLRYRQINYDISMRFKTALSRSIFKRLSLKWIQASEGSEYTITLDTMFNNAGLEANGSVKHRQAMAKRALKELEDNGVIEVYEENAFNKNGEKHKRGQAISEVRYCLFAHKDFIKSQKRANKLKKILIEQTIK